MMSVQLKLVKEGKIFGFFDSTTLVKNGIKSILSHIKKAGDSLSYFGPRFGVVAIQKSIFYLEMRKYREEDTLQTHISKFWSPTSQKF